jgi:uncharacterized protein YndB with AHSA1/START domain
VLKRWFAPKPYETRYAELDVRPGGSNLVGMREPDGPEMPNRGVYLDVQPDRRLVVTERVHRRVAPFRKGPHASRSNVRAEGEGTRYTGIVRHWSAQDRDAHERMGFHAGWGMATDQSEEVVATL